MSEKKAIIEAALFMTSEPITAAKLAKVAEINPDQVREILSEIKKDYEEESHGIFLLKTEDGYQFKVKPDFVKHVRHLTPYQDLSKGLLRVLALVAYRQPMTQSDVVKVIGNRAYHYVKKLEAKGLLRTVKHGRTKALIATKEFANYFGLEKPEDFKKFFEEMTEKEKETSK